MLTMPPGQPLRQVGKTIILPLLHLHGGERPLVPQSYYHSALQCQLWVQEVPEAGLCIILCPA